MTPHQMANWDIAALRRGSAEFTEVAESTRDWVTRGDAIGQRLSAPHAWDGPASEAALSTHRSWLAVAARLNPALAALARGIAEAVGWYDQAQDAAASALRCAATAGIAVGANGVLSQPLGPTASMEPDQAAAAAERAAIAATVQALLDEAFRLAARGDALIASDVGVFAGLGVPGFTANSSFVDLMTAVHVTFASAQGLPTIPYGATPTVVAAWWSGLSLDEQLRLARERPELIGGLDGVPAWVRDTANRILLDNEVREWSARAAGQTSSALFTPINPELHFALAVQEALALAEAQGRVAQLYQFDPAAGFASIAVGDLDTAGSVALIVPGTTVDVTTDMTVQVARAVDVWSATESLDDDDVAVMAWIGYDAPSVPGALGHDSAATGGPLLATSLAGLAAARPTSPPRTTVIAHSYGTLTTSRAAAEPGPLQADAVVLLGSPGTGGLAGDLNVSTDQVFVGEAEEDWIADTGWHGTDPGWTWWYGGTCIAAEMPEEDDSDHYHYFDPESEALHNMALIVQGRYRSVVDCDD